MSRSREMPSGTDGGRKQPTAIPAARQSAAQRTAASGEGALTETTAASGRTAVSPSAVSRSYSAVATVRALPARGKLAAQQAQARESRARRGRCEPGVEDEGAGRVDQMVDHPGRAEDGSALTAQGLGEGEGGDDPVTTRETGGGEGAAPALPEHTQTVRVVDEQRGALRTADVGQFRQRRGVSVDGEDRVGDGQGAAAVRAQLLGDGFGIGVGYDDGVRPGEAAAVHDGGVIARVGDDQGATAGEGGEGGEIGRVAGGEDEGRFETAEFGEFAFELGVQRGGTGDQPGAGGARTPPVRGLGGGSGHLGVPGEAQVVVAREVQQFRLGGPGAQSTDEPGVRTAARLVIDPVERGEGHGGGPFCRQLTDPNRGRGPSWCGNTHMLCGLCCPVPPWLRAVP